MSPPWLTTSGRRNLLVSLPKCSSPGSFSHWTHHLLKDSFHPPATQLESPWPITILDFSLILMASKCFLTFPVYKFTVRKIEIVLTVQLHSKYQVCLGKRPDLVPYLEWGLFLSQVQLHHAGQVTLLHPLCKLFVASTAWAVTRTWEDGWNPDSVNAYWCWRLYGTSYLRKGADTDCSTPVQ